MAIKKAEQKIADAVRVLQESGLLKWKAGQRGTGFAKLEIRLCWDDERENLQFFNFVDTNNTLSSSRLSRKDSAYFDDLETEE
jgi:hypothetical protein